MWILAVMALGAACVIAAIGIASFRARRRSALPGATATSCPVCGYDLTGLSKGTCPECGDSAATRRAVRRTTEQKLASIDRLLVQLVLGAAALAAAAIVIGWLLQRP
ncbi:MAG: hypothetical protein AMXMBFR58_07810 [Phycisphaerae bacterium]